MLISSQSLSTVNQLQEMVQSVPFWWHSIDLGNGVITNGQKSLSYLAAEVENLHLPSLKGKSVLDIGAWDGFFSFEAERRGAARVLALDHYAWSVDWTQHHLYYVDCQSKGFVPEPRASIFWRPEELPGKKGFDVARKALESRVEARVADFMEMDLGDIGTFDVVLYLGVLYHLQNPLESLKRLAHLTNELAIIETEAVVFPGFEHHAFCEFFESNELGGDPTNWWAPNMEALLGMCRAAGFRQVEALVKSPLIVNHQVYRYRTFVHAWK